MPTKTRSKTTTTQEGKSATTSRRTMKTVSPRGADIPPSHTINLSLPSEQRYVALATLYQSEISDLTGLFDEVCEDLLTMYGLSLSALTVKQFARVLLRRVHDEEQTRELRGISKATGVEMFLLVAFNVVLDLLMGCTSGGVRVHSDSGQTESKMVHFRTLDWGMDVLRRVVVCLEFVEREGGPVVARSVTYVGFVGMLTGVRKGLSLSLNYRGLHNYSDSRVSNALYMGHHLLVLLGLRPSIGSTLRHLILPPTSYGWSFWRNYPTLPSWEWLTKQLPSLPTSSCYLIFCNGQETLTVEKDRVTGVSRTSNSFISATNHDSEHEDESMQKAQDAQKAKGLEATGMLEVISESVDRKGCLERCFQDTLASHDSDDATVRMKDVENWLGTYPVLNECTHYAVIMDPGTGEIIWLRRWMKPYRHRKRS